MRSLDPSLSPEANRLLTDELRAVVGRDRVDVPADTPEREREAHAKHRRLPATLFSVRPAVIVALTLLVVAAITTLTTGSWIAATVLAALAVTCGLGAGLGALGLTTEVEHLSPEVAARLEAEGVADPDRVFGQLLEEFAGGEARGTAEVLASGANERTAVPEDDPVGAAMEQSTTWTPTSEPGVAAGRGGAVSLIEWGFTAGLLLLTLVVAIIEGGAFWIVPAIVALAGGAWALVRSRMDDAREERRGDAGRSGTGRGAGDDGPERARLVPLLAGVALAVVGFLLLMGVVAGAL